MAHAGNFTQAKILTETIQSALWFRLEDLIILDDVSDTRKPYTYALFCKVLRENGRVSLLDEHGRRLFQVTDCIVNQLRGDDVNPEGEPQCNPVR
jgi:hypothetical protein